MVLSSGGYTVGFGRSLSDRSLIKRYSVSPFLTISSLSSLISPGTMNPELTPTSPGVESASPIRRSCDRCHKQKLRCTRAENSRTGACDRCLPKRAKCVYSSSLPKGRPSVHRATSSTVEELTSLPSPPPPPPPPASLPDPVPCSSEPPSASTSASASDTPLSPPFPRMSCTALDPFAWGGGPLGEMASWGDGMVDNSTDQDWGQSMLNWQHIVDPVQTGSGKVAATSFPHLPDSTATEMDCDDVESAQVQNLLSHVQVYDYDYDYPGSGSSNNSHDAISIIAELAKLSVRLSQLGGRLSSLPRQSHHPVDALDSSPLIDDVTFELVSAWLARGSLNINSSPPLDPLNIQSCPLPAASETKTVGAMLYFVFSASHHFLEILNYVQANIGTSTPTSTSSTSSILLPATSESALSGLHSKTSLISSVSSSLNSGMPSQKSSSSYNNIIRQMLSACHATLLNVYVAILVILEREAVYCKLRTHRGPTAALGDIRLVMVVQLCSYLIKRQHQALDLYLASKNSQYTSMPLDLVDLFGVLQPDPPASDASTRKALHDLRIEVQQRLVRLQQTLSI